MKIDMINSQGKISILIVAILIVAIVAIFQTLNEKNKEYYEREAKFQKRYDSLESELRRTERSLMVLVLRLDSARIHNKNITSSLDSVQFILSKYKNPYVNKTDKQLSDIMNQRANGKKISLH